MRLATIQRTGFEKSKNSCFSSILLLYTSNQPFFGFTGPFGFDDIEYARLGHLFVTGNPDFTNAFTFRFGVILPIGFLQNTFGVTDSVAAIYPLALSLVLIYTVIKTTNLNWKTSFIALAILFSCPWMVFYSDKIGADIPVTVYILTAIYVLYLSRFNNKSIKHSGFYGVVFSLILFAGLLTKETVWFLVPLLGILFVSDIFKKQNFSFWKWAIFSIAVLMFAYLLWQKLMFNDWFYRFNLIKAGDNTNLCSYDRQPFIIVFKRITTELWAYLMAESTFIIPVVLILSTLHKRFFQNLFSKEHFWQLSSIVLILSANFWTISYNSYHPLCVDIRHYLYIFPVCAIAIANNYKMLFRRWAVILVLVTCLLTLLFQKQLHLKEVAVIDTYITIAVFAGLLLLRKWKIYFLMGIICIPFYNLYLQVKTAKEYDYRGQEKVARDFLKDKHDVTIYTAETQKRLFNYYLGFENKRNLSIDPYKYFSELESGYHYWNYHAIFLSQEFDAIPAAIQASSTPETQIKNSEIIKIYKIDQSGINVSSYNLNSPFFNAQFNKIGTINILPNQEFGPTFSKKIPSNANQISVSSEWILTNKSLKGAFLVFALEEDGNLLYYQAYPIKTDRATFNNKYKLFKAVDIDLAKVNKQAVLKVYIWNNEGANLNVSEAKIILAEN